MLAHFLFIFSRVNPYLRLLRHWDQDLCAHDLWRKCFLHRPVKKSRKQDREEKKPSQGTQSGESQPQPDPADGLWGVNYTYMFVLTPAKGAGLSCSRRVSHLLRAIQIPRCRQHDSMSPKAGLWSISHGQAVSSKLVEESGKRHTEIVKRNQRGLCEIHTCLLYPFLHEVCSKEGRPFFNPLSSCCLKYGPEGWSISSHLEPWGRDRVARCSK